MSEPQAFSSRVEALRARVYAAGGATVPWRELIQFCPAEMTAAEQFMCIASLARKEGWSFAFLGDGSRAVHFEPLLPLGLFS